MLHTNVACATGCNDPDCQTHGAPNQRIELKLQYTDKKHDIELNTNVSSPPTLNIHDMTLDVLEFLYLDDIPPEEVRFVGFSRNGHRYRWNSTDKQTTLQKLGVTEGCILYFEPTPTAVPPKLCHLTIVGPDEVKRIKYQWYRAKTTLAMLLEYVIENFSLELVERERIHLLTIFKELNFLYHSDKRLCELDLHDGMMVHVQIISPLPSTTMNENKDVHVKCTSDKDKFNLDVPNTETIGELKVKIEKRYEDRQINDFKLCNEKNDEFDLNGSDRTIESYGVKAGQTISATFRLIKRNALPPVVNKQSEASTKSSLSLTTKQKHNKVTVMCIFPLQNPECFQIPVTNTVNQLIKEIENLTHNQRLVISKMHSKTIDIDLKNDKSLSLDGLGFKQDDVINVTIIDKSPIHSSVLSKPPPSSPKADKLSKAHPTNQTPIGLVNLGNSCYMNSALQCLTHVLPLTKFFLEDLTHTYSKDDTSMNSNGNTFDQIGEVTGAYADLLWNLFQRNRNDYFYQSFKPIRIKKTIHLQAPQFAEWEQQDTKEFITFFLNAIHEELKAKNKNQRNTIIKKLFFGEITSTITCTACNKEDSTTHPISFLSIPLNRQERKFYINFISKEGKDDLVTVEAPITGRVEHVVDNFTESYGRPSLFHYILAMIPDRELDFKTPLSEIPTDELIFMEQEDRSKNIRPERLGLPVKKSILEDYLKDFFSPEELEDGCTCQQKKCEEKTSASKELKLLTLPPVLIIQFKRFSYEEGLRHKNETSVNYPIKGLDLNKCLPLLEEEAIYDLIAVSNHMGSIYGGHYTTYARHETDGSYEWYLFDDSRVSLVSFEDDIISKNAYLLFYIKRNILENQAEITII